MPTENTPPKDPTAEESKELKKLLDSHVAVLTHKFKRAPTMEELTQFLTGGTQPTQTAEPTQKAEGSQEGSQEGAPADPQEPKILSYKVYCGLKKDGDKKVLDPAKILFYETGAGQLYDTSRHEWCQARPSIVDHLPSRDMMFDENGQDIMAAIVHGVMDDEDFAALDGANMLNDYHKEVWQLNKQLQSQMAQLEKSEDEPEDTMTAEEAAETPEQEAAESLEHQEAEAQAGTEKHAQGEPDLAGDNVFEQIVQAAMAEALDGAMADLEPKIRSIVRDEIERLMSAGENASEPEEFEIEEEDMNT